ncbi:hypothetical protein E2C01_004394 [Portunus trituberculatus]|uniref:Uncharacterized protein n=1 Tax=Portunus trituberculatus TaxID=210409 RepID=A0A5B7CQK2_PORTR|nr:hypothetical protein [Portunus trituberculatus]
MLFVTAHQLLSANVPIPSRTLPASSYRGGIDTGAITGSAPPLPFPVHSHHRHHHRDARGRTLTTPLL